MAIYNARTEKRREAIKSPRTALWLPVPKLARCSSLGVSCDGVRSVQIPREAWVHGGGRQGEGRVQESPASLGATVGRRRGWGEAIIRIIVISPLAFRGRSRGAVGRVGEVLIFAWKVELEVGKRTVRSWLWDHDGDVADHVQVLGRRRAILGDE